MKKTILNDCHKKEGAKLVGFGAYEMPLWYPAGVKKEHLAVISRAGLFDTSHMAVITVCGVEARDLLQVCFSRDLDLKTNAGSPALVPGKSVYGAFLSSEGHLIDDAIVSQITPAHYLIVVNSGMGPKIVRHLNQNTGKKQVTLTDLTDQVGKIDLQGPLAGRILAEIVQNAPDILKELSYFSHKGYFDAMPAVNSPVCLKDGTPLLISRSGYTGEFGFELFTLPQNLPTLWEKLMDAGKSMGLLACGLAARDSLRVGALLPLAQKDIGPWPFIRHPWEFTLPYGKDGKTFTKSFIGDGVLGMRDQAEYTLPFVGYDPRKVNPETALVVDPVTGDSIGKVLSCATDMAIDWHADRILSLESPGRPAAFTPSGLACGFVKVGKALTRNQDILLKDGKRSLNVKIVDTIRPDRTARLAMNAMLTP